MLQQVELEAILEVSLASAMAVWRGINDSTLPTTDKILETRGAWEENRSGMEGFWAKVLERFAKEVEATLAADLQNEEAIAEEGYWFR